jgi:hypothetical protein
MDDAADDPAIIRPLDASHIRRQVRFDPLPLLIAEPKQIAAHSPISPKGESRRIESGLPRLGSKINGFRP